MSAMKFLVLALALALPAECWGAFSIPYPNLQSGTASLEKLNANAAAVQSVIGVNTFETTDYLTTDATLTDNLRALDAQVAVNTSDLAAMAFRIPGWASDELYPVTNAYVGDSTIAYWPVTQFPGDTDSAIWFTFRPTKTGYDYKLALEGFMSTAVASSAISMNISVYAIPVPASGVTGTVQPDASGYDGEDEISVPDTKEIRVTHTGTNLKIPSTVLSEANMQVLVKLWRNVGGVSSNHTGAFCLSDIYLTPVLP